MEQAELTENQEPLAETQEKRKQGGAKKKQAQTKKTDADGAANSFAELSVEECFARLDKVLSGMESSETSLEEAFRLYEEGMKLVQAADSGIGRIEKKLQILSGEDVEEDDE